MRAMQRRTYYPGASIVPWYRDLKFRLSQEKPPRHRPRAFAPTYRRPSVRRNRSDYLSHYYYYYYHVRG